MFCNKKPLTHVIYVVNIKKQMQRYFITFAYDGTSYHGWQIQPTDNSVQETMQKALTTILREDIELVGAGRTDTGVHAEHMTAHFETEKDFQNDMLVNKLNSLLPRDIVIFDIFPVSDDMHARFSATFRRYRYYIHTRKDPFSRQYSCELRYHLDFDLMNEAGRILCTYKDFGAFCKSHTDVKTTLCDVTKAEWVRIDDHRWYFEIQANRFLRNMVRAVVGTLVDVGRGRITLDEFRHVIECGNRCKAGESMPANALFLVEVGYDIE